MDYRELDRRIAQLRRDISSAGESVRKEQDAARARGETVRISAGGLTFMEQELERLLQMRQQAVNSGHAPASGLDDTQAMLLGFGAIGAAVLGLVYFFFLR